MPGRLANLRSVSSSYLDRVPKTRYVFVQCLYCLFAVVPEPVINSPRPLGQQSPLPGIEEEDDSDWPLEDATDATLTPSYKSTRSSTDTVYTSSRSSGKKRLGSPSAVKICISAAARKSKSNKARKRGSSGAGQVEETTPPPALGKMQAEQGSIGELQKFI
ncbi:Uncharacterized protein OBRU01_11706 [Operophtera brumata]|uniref:Uncharacterized protein n=1 Tax=Operophtera brumata TaxID=104452 RepID=A0A0L7LBJ5_OPEBR|nr:Uncharacterized protein OBRU01_11706 [Operophtera brumata]